MSLASVTQQYLTDIANAIRAKLGVATTYKPSQMAAAIASIPSGTPTLQTKTKTYTPTESQITDTVSPDAGYDGLDEVDVTVNAIPSNYVGSGIAQRTSSDLTDSGATVTAPAGYYASNASKAVASGSAATPATTITATPTITVSSSGLITASNSKTQNVTPTVSPGYVSSGTAGTITVDGSNTSQLTTQAAQTLYPSTSDQSVSSGKYLTGAQTFKAVKVTNLLASIIKQGEVVQIGDADDADRIMSVTGTYAGGGGSGPTLLTTKDLGTISTSSTSATDTGQTVSVSGLASYDLLVVLTSVKTKTNNRHIGTAQTIWLTASSSHPTKNGATIATATWNAKLSSNGTGTTRSSTTKYGIYVNSATIGSGINPTLTLAMYQRYNNTQTGTINGNYECRVYGVHLYDLIGA